MVTMETAEKTVQVGDVFVESWGYDQTNIDFWQVVRATEKSVWIRPIGSTREEGGLTSERVRPVVDGFLAPSVRGRIGKVLADGSVRKAIKPGWRGEWAIRMTSYSSAYIWDGERSYHQTAYGFGH